MGCKVTVSPGAYLWAALLILGLPGRWWFGAFLAAAIHELSHLAALRLMGGQVLGISIGPLGAKIETMALSRGREGLCAAAGPLGSLMLASVWSWYPEIAVCAGVQGLFNLLPVYPLDGGRVLRTLAPEPVCAGVEVFVIVLLFGLGIWCSVMWNVGPLALLPGCAAAFRPLERKIPCKESKIAVQ